MSSCSPLLYLPQELSFRTQYAELKERTAATGSLLPGTPGMLVKRDGTGYTYWYRAYYAVPGHKVEQLVCKDNDHQALQDTERQIEFALWTAAQVRNLRKLNFQVSDKSVALVLVELHNRGLLGAGLTLVGTLCYMAWLNELGARAVSARTQDIDLAARQSLKLGAPQSFLEALQATRLGFVPIPGMPSRQPPTAVKLEGRGGLRVDVLADGAVLGRSLPIPQLMWHAQTVPYYAYLLDQPRHAATLAGGHCVPVSLPQADRLVWHKLYSSASRRSFPEKAHKDLQQAATLAAILVEQHDEALAASFSQVPTAMRKVVRARLPALRRALPAHPQTLEQFELALR